MHLSQIEFLQHILDECLYLIKESHENNFEDFLKDERLIRAVCRSLEIIGEASSKVHPDIKEKYPLVPWREMNDIRNKIIHHYFGVDYDIVWDTIQTNIPQLKDWIEIIIKKEKA
ncbi:MAG: hypothetical protein JWR09_4252 [Mucilaginibacter sp.]|nr:hypothetical protein [Mucilaginibacter sp.]